MRQSRPNGRELGEVARWIGATDVFVFRRVVDDRYVHVGGVGRGEGWAGNIELSSREEPIVEKAIQTEERAVRLACTASARIVGPYFARAATLVAVSPDVVVLFGNPEHDLADRSDDELHWAAESAAAAIETVSPAKRLADELEVLHALDALRATEAQGVRETMEHVVKSASALLSCEVGVLYLTEQDELAVTENGSPLWSDEETVRETIRALARRDGDLPLCVQDGAVEPLPHPFGPPAGVKSYYLLPLGKPSIGVLLLIHTEANPRGFTMLCQQLGLRLAESAEGMLHTALIRELERRQAAALAEANERLRELDRMKDDFVSLITHELRTPLTSIRGYLEVVLKEEAGGLTDDQRRFLAVVDRNSDRLLRLVSDLLFVARLEAGGLELEPGDVDLAALAAESLESAKPAADPKGIVVDFVAERRPVVRGDRARLGQVLDNLVSNAMKFTPQGGRVAVRVGTERSGAVVEIADTGVGIPLAEQPKLFTRYFRASTATSRRIAGTGLGLSIAKAIMEAHGGEIEVASREHEGTTFRLQLPLAAP